MRARLASSQQSQKQRQAICTPADRRQESGPRQQKWRRHLENIPQNPPRETPEVRDETRATMRRKAHLRGHRGRTGRFLVRPHSVPATPVQTLPHGDDDLPLLHGYKLTVKCSGLRRICHLDAVCHMSDRTAGECACMHVHDLWPGRASYFIEAVWHLTAVDMPLLPTGIRGASSSQVCLLARCLRRASGRVHSSSCRIADMQFDESARRRTRDAQESSTSSP